MRGACEDALAMSKDLVDFVVVVVAAMAVGGGDSVSECASLICEIDEAIDEMEFVRFGAVTMIVEVPLCIGLDRAAGLRRRFLTSSGGAVVWYVVTTGFVIAVAAVTVLADAINASFCKRVGVVFIRVLAIVCAYLWFF